MVVVNIFSPGHWDPYDSYGLIACRLAQHLTERDYYVNAYGHGYVERESQNDVVRGVVTQPRRAGLGGFVLGYPTSYEKYGAISFAGPRIALTMFESSRLPRGWVGPLNQCDAVVVPSQFCRDVFESCGVTVPIHVLPLGVSETYQYVERSIDRPFTYLAFLDRGKRKGGIYALQAFIDAFDDRTDVKLLLKMRPHDKRPRLVITNKNVEVVDHDMTETEMWELYGSADVLINPNMGEGFGLIPREFAATGGLSLATNWGGTRDDIECWGIPLAYTLVKAEWSGVTRLEGQDLGVWAQPDHESIVCALIHAWETREDYRSEAKRISAQTHMLYSWKTWALGMSTLLEGVKHGYKHATHSIAA